MRRANGKRLLAGAVLASIAALAACAPQPAPPPRVVAPVVIPQRPYPPMGASPNMLIPPVGADGVRRTVNTNLGPDQTAWNLRSAYNVAALNCQRPEHAAILEGYKQFLKVHGKGLTAVNKNLDKQFRAEYGSGYIRVRESYNTQVYNYFALPPTLPSFCDAAVVLSQQPLGSGPSDLYNFAETGLAQLETVFFEFYNAYDKYKYDLAVWNSQYGPRDTAIAQAAPADALSAPGIVQASGPGTQTVAQPVVQEIGAQTGSP